MKASLEHFITELTSKNWDEGDVQSLHDMAFLQKLVTLHGEDKVSRGLEKRLEDNVSRLKIEMDACLYSLAAKQC